jgi:hypothetical protein
VTSRAAPANVISMHLLEFQGSLSVPSLDTSVKTTTEWYDSIAEW